MHHDEKYIVFKRADIVPVMEMPGRELNEYRVRIEDVLEDAVVIRTQDVFAHAGLEAYAATVQAFAGGMAGMIAEIPPERRGAVQQIVERCVSIAGYFTDCAAEAEDRAARGECKVPD